MKQTVGSNFLESGQGFLVSPEIGEAKAKVVHQNLKGKTPPKIHRMSQNLVTILTSQKNETEGQD